MSNSDHAKAYMKAFLSEGGPSAGSGRRRGGFNIVRYKQRAVAQAGIRESQRKASKTRKEFIAIMVGRGMDADWAAMEFDRRLRDPAYGPSMDPDTKLPTVQVAESWEEAYTDKHRVDEVETTTKDKKNPKVEDMDMLCSSLGADYSESLVVDAIRRGDFTKTFAGDFGPAASSSSVSAKDFFQRVDSPSVEASPALTTSTCSGGMHRESNSGASLVLPSPSKKFFDVHEESIKLRDKALKEFRSLERKLDDAAKSLRGALKEGVALKVQDPHIFEKRFDMLKKRGDILLALHGHPVDGEDMPNLQDLVGKLDRELAAVLLLGLPLSDLAPAQDLERSIYKIGSGAVEASDLSADYDRWLSSLKPVSVVMAAVQSSITGLASAKKAKARDDEQAAKRAVAKAKAEAKFKAKEGATLSGTRKSAGGSLYKAFDVSISNDIPVPDALDSADGSGPYILRSADIVTKLGEANPCRLNLLVFKAGLSRSSVPREQRSLSGAAAARDELLQHAVKDGIRVLRSHPALSSVSVFGSKRGAEFCGLVDTTCMGVVRAYMVEQSAATIIVVSTAALARHLRQGRTSAVDNSDCSKPINLLDLKLYLKTLSQEALDGILTSVPVFSGFVQTGFAGALRASIEHSMVCLRYCLRLPCRA